MASAARSSGPDPAPTCRIGPDLWFRREDATTYRVGLTDAAQRRAGPIVHCRGPEAGRSYRRGEPVVSIESQKWVGHLGVPVDGTVLETNPLVEADPATINRDPYGAGWLYRLHPSGPGALEALAEASG